MKYKIFNNKRAYSLSGWAETAILVTLFMLLIGLLIVNMNVNLDEDYDSTFVGSDRLEDIQDDLIGYQDTLEQGVKEGQATSSGTGLGWTDAWNILSGGAKIMWNFLTGGFIEDIFSLMRFPIIVGRLLRILFVLSIGFILLKLVLRVKP